MRFKSVIAALVVALPSAAAAQVVHSSNFNSGVVPGGYSVDVGGLGVNSASGACTSGTYCTPFLGMGGGLGLDNQNVSLALSGLGAHSSATVKFSLFILDSWDGRGYWCCGPDVAGFKADGVTLMRTTFSNTGGLPGNEQCFPTLICGDVYNDGPNAAQSGAAEANTLGYNFYGNSVYELSFTFAHTGSSLALDWYATGLQGTLDESWGLDNVSVELTGGRVVPEPATFALMATGLLGLGVVARRRRA